MMMQSAAPAKTNTNMLILVENLFYAFVCLILVTIIVGVLRLLWGLIKSFGKDLDA